MVEEKLHTQWAARKLVLLEQIDSTNEEAKRLAQGGAPHGTLVVAQMQHAGKGRLGRSFDSPKDQGIFMSLVIRDQIKPQKASMLTLVMGLAAQKAVERMTGIRSQIKWPNDLIVDGKKLCGILTEMSLMGDEIHFIVVGVGMNVHNQSFPAPITDVATSIAQHTKKPVGRWQLMEAILQEFEILYQSYVQTQDLSEMLEDYNECLINRGKQVNVLDPRGSYEGLALGINAEGDLLVKTQQGVKQVFSGEVSVRGVLGYV